MTKFSLLKYRCSIKDNPKSYWLYVNKAEHEIFDDPKLIAEEMNEFFFNSLNNKSIHLTSFTSRHSHAVGAFSKVKNNFKALFCNIL